MADVVNEPTISALTLDRSLPVGDSPCDDGRGRLHVRVCNKATEPIPVTVAGSVNNGTPFYKDSSDVGTPGVTQTLFSLIVPANTDRQLKSLIVTSRTNSCWSLKADGSVIASGRTAPGHPESLFRWDLGRSIVSGSMIDLEFTEAANQPASDVEAYLQALDVPV